MNRMVDPELVDSHNNYLARLDLDAYLYDPLEEIDPVPWPDDWEGDPLEGYG